MPVEILPEGVSLVDGRLRFQSAEIEAAWRLLTRTDAEAGPSSVWQMPAYQGENWKREFGPELWSIFETIYQAHRATPNPTLSLSGIARACGMSLNTVRRYLTERYADRAGYDSLAWVAFRTYVWQISRGSGNRYQFFLLPVGEEVVHPSHHRVLNRFIKQAAQTALLFEEPAVLVGPSQIGRVAESAEDRPSQFGRVAEERPSQIGTQIGRVSPDSRPENAAERVSLPPTPPLSSHGHAGHDSPALIEDSHSAPARACHGALSGSAAEGSLAGRQAGQTANADSEPSEPSEPPIPREPKPPVRSQAQLEADWLREAVVGLNLKDIETYEEAAKVAMLGLGLYQGTIHNILRKPDGAEWAIRWAWWASKVQRLKKAPALMAQIIRRAAEGYTEDRLPPEELRDAKPEPAKTTVVPRPKVPAAAPVAPPPPNLAALWTHLQESVPAEDWTAWFATATPLRIEDDGTLYIRAGFAAHAIHLNRRWADRLLSHVTAKVPAVTGVIFVTQELPDAA